MPDFVPPKEQPAPELKARKGVSLFLGHAVCPCREVGGSGLVIPGGLRPQTALPSWGHGRAPQSCRAVTNGGREVLGRGDGMCPPCLHPEDKRSSPGAASRQGAGRGGLENILMLFTRFPPPSPSVARGDRPWCL